MLLQTQPLRMHIGKNARENSDHICMAIEAKHDDGDGKQGSKVPAEE